MTINDNQINLEMLIEHQKKGPAYNSCGVVMNGEFQEIDWKSLFNSSKYDQLSCVTYVSSAGFFAKATEGFKNVKLIFGIDKENVRKAFNKNLMDKMSEASTAFFLELPDECKERIINSSFDLRYSKPDSIIHSKFYLLSSSKSDETRLIFGSANLTTTAFSNKVRQYEDVMVFDNDPLFNEYQKRFEALYSETEEYIPREVIEKHKEGNLIAYVDLTSDERTDNFIELLQEKNIVPILNEDIINYAEEAADDARLEAEEEKKFINVVTKVSKVDRKTGELTLRPMAELVTLKPKIADMIFKSTRTEEKLARFRLSFNESNKKQYRLYADSEENATRQSEIYDKEASKEEITKSIQTIENFIEAYRTFTSGQDINEVNISRIYEILLYSFMAPYAFRLRQDTLGSRSDIPVALVIGGRAYSGKSHLLAFIDKLMSGRSLVTEQHYIDYKLLNVKGVEALYYTDNTYPIMVDEVAASFFTGAKGEDLIKSVSNSLSGKHPVMICTTNTRSFNMPAQVGRRVYYLQVDASFDTSKKTESSTHYENVMAAADNTLFRDFCFRVGQKISFGEDLFGENKFDYLATAREIFKEYYAIAGIELPKCFPEKLYNDYEYRGKNMWEKLFTQNIEQFKYVEEGKSGGAELTVNLKSVVSSGNYDKNVDVYLNYLQQDILIEDAGIYVTLKADSFFDWVGIRSPYRKRGLFEKIFGVRNLK